MKVAAEPAAGDGEYGVYSTKLKLPRSARQFQFS